MLRTQTLTYPITNVIRFSEAEKRQSGYFFLPLELYDIVEHRDEGECCPRRERRACREKHTGTVFSVREIILPRRRSRVV